MNKVAVVILNYNGEKFLQSFLPSVVKYSGKAAIIVADNASTDNSIEFLSTNFPTVKCIRLSQNYGFCTGYNKALNQVEAEYFVLLNSDVDVTSGWLDPLVSLLDENPMMGAVQPKILSYHDKNYFEYAGAAGGYIDRLGYPFCRGRIFDSLEQDQGQYNDVKEIFWASGACMLIRSSLYKSLNGLDDDFFAHMEEIDLCWRIKRIGYSVYYNGASTVFHVGGGTMAKANPQKTFLNFRNGLYLIVKNMSWPELSWKLPVRLCLDGLAALRFLYLGQSTHALAILRAHRCFIGNISKLLVKRRSFTQTHIDVKRPALSPLFVVWDFFVLKKRKIKLF